MQRVGWVLVQHWLCPAMAEEPDRQTSCMANWSEITKFKPRQKILMDQDYFMDEASS